MNKAHMQECFKPHTMLHSLFGLGLGIIAADLLGLTGTTGIILGIVVMAIALIGDVMMGKKKAKS